MLSRRETLRGGTAAVAAIAAAGAVAAAAVPTLSAADTDLLALSDRYWTFQEEANRLDRSSPGKSSAERDAIWDKINVLDDEAFEIASRISNMQARTPAGLAAKLRIVRLEAGYGDDVKILSDPFEQCERTVALGLWTAREDALALSGVAATSGAAVAVSASQDTEDPAIEAAARHYRAMNARRDELPDDPTNDEFYERYFHPKTAAYDALMGLPAASLTGLAIKARIYRSETLDLVEGYKNNFDLDGLLEDIERLTGEAS